LRAKPRICDRWPSLERKTSNGITVHPKLLERPAPIVRNNGTELTFKRNLRWADDHKVAWHYIEHAFT
jgi:hypothetical protein